MHSSYAASYSGRSSQATIQLPCEKSKYFTALRLYISIIDYSVQVDTAVLKDLSATFYPETFNSLEEAYITPDILCVE